MVQHQRKSGENGDGETTPLVIPQDRHPIRNRDIDREALKVLFRLRDAGFAGYLVGGGVRDLYLGKQPKDFDISTDARPGQLRRLFRNSRTIGRRFRLVQVYFRGGKIIEVSTLRSRSEYDLDDPDQVLPANNTYGTLEEDAFRRDLTINSLFYEIEHNTIIDYVGGVADLEAGIIRFIGDPWRRITRDPVRMMRAIRHAARNDFRIEDSSWQAIVANLEKLRLCPTSRIRDEVLKDLRSTKAAAWARLAERSGMLAELVPCYREQGFPGDRRRALQLLYNLLGIVDHVLAASQEPKEALPETMLFAALFLPWAAARYDLLSTPCKGPRFQEVQADLRAELDEMLGERLNVKRMVRDTITSMMLHLGTLRAYSQDKRYPKWLRRKSYFPACQHLLSLYTAAQDGGLPEGLAATASGEGQLPASPAPERGGGRSRQRIRPAFSSRKSGVFGLRRH